LPERGHHPRPGDDLRIHRRPGARRAAGGRIGRDSEAGGNGRMKFYEIATLKTVIFGAGKAAPAIEAWVKAPEAKGTLLGAFASDIGALNEVYVFRGFDSLEDLAAERDRALRSDNPFGCLEHLVDLDFDSYRPLDFLPPVTPGTFGPFYE